MRGDVAAELLDAVRDEGWFFDTELLVLAQRRGMRIHEVAVDWVDDPDSRVDIVSTALEDLRGVARLALAAPITRFLGIGVASTLAYALLFLLLAGTLGSVLASAVALAATAVANTAANRRLTFGIRGRERLAPPAPGGLHRVRDRARADQRSARRPARRRPTPAPGCVEAAVLVLANLAATVTRYVALATWVFRARPAPLPVPAGGHQL